MKKMNFKGIMKKVFNEKVKNVIIAALVCVISVFMISIVNGPALSMHSAKAKITEYQDISKKSAKDSEEYTEAMKNYNEASEIYSQESYKYQNYEGFPIVSIIVRFYANVEANGAFYVILLALALRCAHYGRRIASRQLRSSGLAESYSVHGSADPFQRTVVAADKPHGGRTLHAPLALRTRAATRRRYRSAGPQ